MNKPKLWNFSNKNGRSRKIISIEAIIVVEANKLQANCKLAKELQIKGKYETKQTTLNAEYFSLLSKTLSLFQLDILLDPNNL